MAKRSSEAEFVKAEMNVKAKIAAEPKRTVMIVPGGNDKNWRGSINGVKYSFPKGEFIEVPESLYFIIANSAEVKESIEKFEKANSNVQIAY